MHASLPCLTPSVGTPGSTGPGLVVSPWRIVSSHADEAFGWLGETASSSAGSQFGPIAAPSPPQSGATFFLGSLGCCCVTNKFCVVGCYPSYSPVPFATITLTRTDGTIAGTCITGSSGCCTINVAKGSYILTVYVNGVVVNIPGLISVTPGNTITINPYCCPRICVLGCDGGPYTCGASVTIKNATTGSTLFSGSTDPTTGCVTALPISLAQIAPLIGLQTVMTVNVTASGPGYMPYSQNMGLCNGEVTINLPVDPAYVCCTGATPIKATLTLTDANGSHAFVYTGVGPGDAGWSCCYTIETAPCWGPTVFGDPPVA